MRRLPLTAFVLAVLAFALLVVGVHAALPSDEDRLKQTNVQTDNRSLFALIRPRTPPEPAAIAGLIRKLGNDQFKQREEAERALRAIGRPALPALDKAATDPDAEIARRAKDCRETIVQQLGPQAEQALLAVRLLLRRAPHGVVAALLEHLPAAPSTDVEEAIWFGIDALAARAKELDPALVAGLTDPHPARRALAACLVGRLGDARQKDSVRRLLNDKDPNVRLRAAQGLLAGRDAAGVPALIALLDQPDTALAWQAEELLHFLAGETAAESTVVAGAPVERQRCRKAWQHWYESQGRKPDPGRPWKEPGRPGLLLLVCLNSPDFGVYLFGCLGQARWKLEKFWVIADVQLLPDNRVLLAEITPDDNSVKELKLNGDACQNWVLPIAGRQMGRLPGGTTWIVTPFGHRIHLHTGQGDAVAPLRLPERIIQVARDGAGRLTGLAMIQKNLALVDLQWGNPVKGGPPLILDLRPNKNLDLTLAALPDGGVLLSGHESGLVVEFDRTGKRIWEARPETPSQAIRLPDGRRLIADGGRVTEVNRQGKVVWEAVPPNLIRCVRSCLNLVRVGFPPADTDIDRSVAYRIEALKSREAERRQQAALVLSWMGKKALRALPPVTDALKDNNRHVRRQAANCLASFGPRAKSSIPALIHALDEVDEGGELASYYLEGYYEALGNIGPSAHLALRRALLEDPRPTVRARAAPVLQHMTDEFPVPVADLQVALKDKAAVVRQAAVLVLGQLAPSQAAVVPALIEALADEDPDVRHGAVFFLADAGPAADSALPALLKLLKQDEPKTQDAVLLALGNIGQRNRAVLSVLLPILADDKQRERRKAAVQALGRLGSSGKAAVPRLIALLSALEKEDDANSAELSREIILVLGGLALFDSDALRVVTEQLAFDGYNENRHQAAVAVMKNLGPRGKAGIPALIKRLYNGVSGGHVAEMQALAQIGAEAVPALLSACKKVEENDPVPAMTCLGRMGAVARPAVPVLIDALKNSKWAHTAAKALGGIGPDARASIPALLAALKTKDENTCACVIEALGAIGVGNKEVSQALLAVAKDRSRSETIHCTALWSLGMLGPVAKNAVPLLLDELKTPNNPENRDDQWGHGIFSRVWPMPAPALRELKRERFTSDPRGCALLALGRLGPAAESAQPALLALCEDARADQFERRAAAEALGQIGMTGKDVTRLVRLLQDDETPWPVQTGVIRALAAQGALARPAIPDVKRLSVEGMLPVRLAARMALGKIK